MRKAIISFAAIALALTSCDTGVKDSTTSYTYSEYNLIVDLQDLDQPAQVSTSKYYWTYNISKNLINIAASDLNINNQKYSFETDDMKVDVSYFTSAGGIQTDRLSFSQTTPNASFSELKGAFVYWILPNSSSLLYPPSTLTTIQFLDLSYTLSDRYQVQSFWCSSYYTGNSYVFEENASFSTGKTSYNVDINFEKKLASVMIYYPEYSVEMPKDYPEVICISNIPVEFTHDSFRLKSTSPTTTILGKDDKGLTAMVESDKFKATNFELSYLSPKLTDAEISYELNGRKYSFQGCTVLKAGK